MIGIIVWSNFWGREVINFTDKDKGWVGKPLTQGSLLSGQQSGQESRVATSRQPSPFGLPPASASWACSQSTPDRCSLSCIPGSLLTNSAAQFSLALINTVETLPCHTALCTLPRTASTFLVFLLQGNGSKSWGPISVSFPPTYLL